MGVSLLTEKIDKYMAKIDSVAVVSGIVFLSIGIVLSFVSFFFLPALIYAIPALIIGVIILVTLREQEEIEQIKDKKEIKRSKSKN